VFAQDYRNLQSLLKELWSDESKRPKLIGNDCNTNPKYLAQWLPLLNDNVLDVLTYHRYVGYGLDSNLTNEIMTPTFLDQAIDTNLTAVHTKFAPSSALWVGEGAAAWHSGRANVTDAFVSSFWWSDALGKLAQFNHTGYQRQTLVGGSYGLIDRVTFEPNPDYYVGMLFKRLMGNLVLKPMTNSSSGWLRVYSHCTQQVDGDITILAINVANDTFFHLTTFNNIDFSTFQRDEYVFTAPKLDSRMVQLNGKPIHVSPTDGSLPDLVPKTVKEDSGGVISLGPHSISFFVLKGGDLGGVCTKSSLHNL